jgi:hypothetical protein
MMVPTDTWLEIISYRDFYDVPRLILASDQGSNFWVLDSCFDDTIDEYPDSYRVYFLGCDAQQAKTTFEAHAKGDKEELSGLVPLAQLQFDATKRRQLFLKPL